MRNQILLWAMLIVPWPTLFLLKKQEVKRFMPVAILSGFASMIIHQMGLSFGWWKLMETNWPLQLPFYLIGINPVMTLWIFKFTYKKFWLYMIVEIVANLGFDLVFLHIFIARLGILTNTPFIAFGMATGLGILLYLYQIWQDGVFIKSNDETESSQQGICR